jgi:hypothetical protein
MKPFSNKVYICSNDSNNQNVSNNNPYQWVDILLTPLFIIGTISLCIYFIPETIYHTLRVIYMILRGDLFR